MRILVVTNSYPTRATPSAAPYITSRLAQLRRHLEVEIRAVALPPVYTAGARLARAAARLADEESLALAPGDSGLESASPRWSLADLARVRVGRRPSHAVRCGVDALQALLDADRSFTPDVVHAHGMYALPAGELARVVAQRLGVPFVVSLHGSDVTQVIRRDPASAAATLRVAAATSYVSEALREEAAGYGLPMERSRVVPNGVDLDLFQPADRRASGAESPGPRLLYVGNLLPVKGVDRLPDVMAQVRRSHPDARLDVVGDGPLRGALERGLGAGDVVHGRLAPAQVARHMQAADALLVPSRAEGWGCVATEALACATPVVATRVGGLPEAVGPGGQLVDPADDGYSSRFAAAIEDVLADPPPPPVLTGAAAGLSWARVVDRELEMLADVVAQ